MQAGQQASPTAKKNSRASKGNISCIATRGVKSCKSIAGYEPSCSKESRDRRKVERPTYLWLSPQICFQKRFDILTPLNAPSTGICRCKSVS